MMFVRWVTAWGTCMMAGSFAEEGKYSYVADIQHADLFSWPVYPLQLDATELLVWYVTEQLALAVVEITGSQWWCTWWSWDTRLWGLCVWHMCPYWASVLCYPGRLWSVGISTPTGICELHSEIVAALNLVGNLCEVYWVWLRLWGLAV